MKIYTKTGDDGSTGLAGGARVSKSDAQIESYGTVDELNAAMGLAAVVAGSAMAEATVEALGRVQNELFVIGAILAMPAAGSPRPSRTAPPELSESSIARLEGEIDAAQKKLPALTQFILPGGCEAAARLHLARTICRRAERGVVGLAERESGAAPLLIIKYLNRLSDWLFVQARLANHVAGVGDVPWEKESAGGARPT
jgi:cob(I)alamin adenosyltransferase